MRLVMIRIRRRRREEAELRRDIEERIIDFRGFAQLLARAAPRFLVQVGRDDLPPVSDIALLPPPGRWLPPTTMPLTPAIIPDATQAKENTRGTLMPIKAIPTARHQAAGVRNAAVSTMYLLDTNVAFGEIQAGIELTREQDESKAAELE